MTSACSIRVRGVVQGVGFRPFVYRLAREHRLAGWVSNAGDGVEIHLEGSEETIKAFLLELPQQAPASSQIASMEVEAAAPKGIVAFGIRESIRLTSPTARISPDIGVCDRCLAELFDALDSRFLYPYINCTNCGPRYSIILSLPYDRERTTMAPWRMDERCAAEFADPSSRRFHAQPIACADCGPHYKLRIGKEVVCGIEEIVRRSASLLSEGRIVALKGVGGYHVACDARDAAAVGRLRERKYRKEKPFAVMARDVAAARSVASLSAESERLLTSVARPIVLAPATIELPDVAPENDALGIMLPYTPLHYLLFAAGAPDLLVMTSGNHSNEPIAYEDEDALDRLDGIADAFLIGERPVARRVEDSVVLVGPAGPAILRRSRGYAPGVVADLPVKEPILALGADLKSAITLVVDGQAFVSQHLGDLECYPAFRAFQETILDMLDMYDVNVSELTVVSDLHPEYLSSVHSKTLDARTDRAVQHHRAHVASVIAERGEWERRIVGLAMDGTGYGDDGTIWGGEVFIGSVAQGFDHVAHLRPAKLVGGDAAARHPVQAAAGFLCQLESVPDLTAAPFRFPARYRSSVELLRTGARVFSTTSTGRLFDTVAALLGFTREIAFEGQAATWLEQLSGRSAGAAPYEFPFIRGEMDFRPLLQSVVNDRARRRSECDIARAFHAGMAHGLFNAAFAVCENHEVDTVVASGGVFQNQTLLGDLASTLAAAGLSLWTNHQVPPHDGGISLGQAALAAFSQFAAERGTFQ